MADLREVAEALLASVEVELDVEGQVTLFTVPTGKRCIPTKAVLIAGGDCSSAVIRIGQNGSTDDFIPAAHLTNLVAEYDVAIMRPQLADLGDSSAGGETPDKSKSYAAGTVIEVDVVTPTGDSSAAPNGTMMLFGILH